MHYRKGIPMTEGAESTAAVGAGVSVGVSAVVLRRETTRLSGRFALPTVALSILASVS